MNTYCVILNAVYYVFYLMAVHLDNMIARAIYFPFYVFIKYCLPSHINGKYLKRLHEANDLGYKLFRNPKNGLCINWANVFFGLFYCGYAFIFIGSISGTLVRFFGEFHGIVVYLIPIIPIAIWWYPAQRAVFYKDRYLKYFKQFEKKEKHWLRKWMLITLAFCLGSILTGVLGIYLFFAIAIGRFDLWNLMH